MSARPLLEDITDTARWVAHYRALESERPEGILRDPLARRLAGERGRAIAAAMPKLSLAWVIPVRARVYDELILDALRRGGVSVVLNLAAGMDTRPYRLALPPSLRWIEADLPGIVEAKAAALAGETPACRVERVAIDLTDRAALDALLGRLRAEEARVLVVTEGLLAYLGEPEVEALSRALRASPAVDAWILEAVMPVVLVQSQRAWSGRLRLAGAEMKFAPASGLGFFEASGWRPRVTRSLLDEARRLGREMPFVRVARPISIALRGREAWRKLGMYAVMEKA